MAQGIEIAALWIVEGIATVFGIYAIQYKLRKNKNKSKK
jgi:hypothetical protein